jgi:hypothetical protein
MTFASLSEGIDWTRARWDQQRPVPMRLHEARTTEGALGAPPFTGAMHAALAGKPTSVTDALRTVDCYHPMLVKGMSPRDCPECYGLGLKDVRVDRFRFPMTLALHRLSKLLRQRRNPHPYWLILALADHGWDAHAAARALDLHWTLAEPLFLRAVRQLHDQYQEAPLPRTSWVDKSEAQRNAEQGGPVNDPLPPALEGMTAA